MATRYTREDILKLVSNARERGEIPNLRGMNLSRIDLSGTDLGGVTLSGVDLRGVDLRWINLNGADLSGADLRGVDLRNAFLRWADMRGADLRRANLREADLRWADMRGANLRGTKLFEARLSGVRQILRVDNLPSGQATLVPTADGWHLTVGCWTGTVDELRTLIAGDEWPEAVDLERERRRPYLESLISMCEVHMQHCPGVIEELKEML